MLSIMNKTFIFDLDDTLYSCEEDYSEEIFNAGLIILNDVKEHAPGAKKFCELREKIDMEQMPDKGLGYKPRFAESLVLTYQTICKRSYIKPKNQIIKKLHQIGMSVFRVDNLAKGLIDGAKETLEFLVKNDDTLHLLTRGAEDIQNQKIDLNDARQYFTTIKILETKTALDFKALKNGKKTYSVGDSITSDVNPAIEAGIQPIHIPRETWENNFGKISNPRKVITLKRISDIIEIYDKL